MRREVVVRGGLPLRPRVGGGTGQIKMPFKTPLPPQRRTFAKFRVLPTHSAMKCLSPVFQTPILHHLWQPCQHVREKGGRGQNTSCQNWDDLSPGYTRAPVPFHKPCTYRCIGTGMGTTWRVSGTETQIRYSTALNTRRDSPVCRKPVLIYK